MKVNLAKHKFSLATDGFSGGGVCALNCFVAEYSGRIRRKLGKVDVSHYIYNDKPRSVFSKRNVEALRR